MNNGCSNGSVIKMSIGTKGGNAMLRGTADDQRCGHSGYMDRAFRPVGYAASVS